jgi:DNA-binding MarR family transcriptional regulator
MPETGAPGTSLLFLREEQMRQAQDMLFLAWRDFAGSVDPVLTARGLGRAHHRALHFIARQPGLTVTDLLALLCVTKQSLSRVLAVLVEQGLVIQAPGRRDRRQRLLSLTDAGAALERALFDRQRERLLAAYREAGGPAVEGFRRVMRGLMGNAARKTLDQLHAAPQPRVQLPATAPQRVLG